MGKFSAKWGRVASVQRRVVSLQNSSLLHSRPILPNKIPLRHLQSTAEKETADFQTLTLNFPEFSNSKTLILDAHGSSSISTMRPIRLPEPPSGFLGTPEIFDGSVNAIRRAVVIGNGYAGSENQSIGLVRALGLGDKHSIYRVIRPRGGINEWLRWLPVSLHKIVDNVIRQVFGESKFGVIFQGKKFLPFSTQIGGSVGLSSILEADARRIVSVAHENFENFKNIWKDGEPIWIKTGTRELEVDKFAILE